MYYTGGPGIATECQPAKKLSPGSWARPVLLMDWGRPNNDTGGEFPTAADEPYFGQDGVPWEGKSTVPDTRDEFATSVIVGFGPLLTLVANSRQSSICQGLGKIGPTSNPRFVGGRPNARLEAQRRAAGSEADGRVRRSHVNANEVLSSAPPRRAQQIRKWGWADDRDPTVRTASLRTQVKIVAVYMTFAFSMLAYRWAGGHWAVLVVSVAVLGVIALPLLRLFIAPTPTGRWGTGRCGTGCSTTGVSVLLDIPQTGYKYGHLAHHRYDNDFDPRGFPKDLQSTYIFLPPSSALPREARSTRRRRLAVSPTTNGPSAGSTKRIRWGSPSGISS